MARSVTHAQEIKLPVVATIDKIGIPGFFGGSIGDSILLTKPDAVHTSIKRSRNTTIKMLPGSVTDYHYTVVMLMQIIRQ